MANKNLANTKEVKNFQSGGLNTPIVSQQMNMLEFEPQEQTIDPVSGNEVPLGGTPEGVRDDVDAKLSKGEMVIPEYAVNYHGVETYINSIQKAQEGYRQMQDMGLMGNPDEAIMDESEPLPKMENNNSVPEYQTGGLTRIPLPTVSNLSTPTVPTLNTVQPIRPISLQPTPMMPIGLPLSSGNYKIIPYTNAEGDVIYLVSMNGEIQGEVPIGYYPKDSEQMSDISTEVVQPQQPPIETGLSGQPGVSVNPVTGAAAPSIAPTIGPAVAPTPSPQAVATAATTPSPTRADIISQTSPQTLASTIASQFTSDPRASLTGDTISITAEGIADAAISVIGKQIGFPLGLAIQGITGLMSHATQPQTAVDQAVSGIANTGFSVKSGLSYLAVANPFSIPMTAVYSKADPTFSITPMAALKSIEAPLAHADLTDMTDAQIRSAFFSDSHMNGTISYSGPVGMPTSSGGTVLRDGSFMSSNGIVSANMTMADFNSLTAVQQAINIVDKINDKNPFNNVAEDHPHINIHDEALVAQMKKDPVFYQNKKRSVLRSLYNQQQEENKAEKDAYKQRQEVEDQMDKYGQIDPTGGLHGRSSVTGQAQAAIASPTGAKGIQGIQGPATSSAASAEPGEADVGQVSDPNIGPTGAGQGQGTCFIAGTLVMMADGTKKKIEDIKIGETLLGQDNSHNKVIKYDHPMLDKRQLISINNSKPFMTPEHPIYTRDGWKSYRLSDTIRENPAMKDEMSGQFNVGDEILNVDGVWIEIKTIEAFDNEPQQQLYNFILDGSNTYYADGFLVHNKGIICTELERQGLVSTEIWKDMVGAGGLFPQVVLDGYHLWARPVVRRMKKSDSFSRKIETLAKPVVYQIAAFNGGCGKWSVTGLSMLAVGLPVCAILGAAMLPFKQKNRNLVLGDKQW